MQPPAFDHLSPESLMAFTAGLGNLPREEIQKAKRLYLLNALTQYETMQPSLAAFGYLQGCLAVIPIFWPVLIFQRKAMNLAKFATRQKILNALEVWKDDLGPEYEALRARLEDGNESHGVMR